MTPSGDNSAVRCAWSIASTYAERSRPHLSDVERDRLASALSERVSEALAAGGDWMIRANLVLNEWERREGGEGPRVLAVDDAGGTVMMGRRAVLRR